MEEKRLQRSYDATKAEHESKFIYQHVMKHVIDISKDFFNLW
jgi:hypothetical protein